MWIQLNVQLFYVAKRTLIWPDKLKLFFRDRSMKSGTQLGNILSSFVIKA